ncbi:MAG: hypothetical protein WBC93_04010 [Sulfitobacter sp.]
MSIEMARQGRIRALNLLSSDRTLVRAARSGNDVVMPRKGTIDAHILTELHHGVHVNQLMSETGWSSSKVMEHVYKAAKKARLGVRRQNGILHLVHPEDVTHPSDNGARNACENLRLVANSKSDVHMNRKETGASADRPLLLV